MPKKYFPGLVFLIFSLLWLMPLSGFVLAQDRAPQIEVSEKDIKDFINLLEDPEKRESLVKQLRILAELKQGAAPKVGAEASAEAAKPAAGNQYIDRLFAFIDGFSKKIGDAGKKVIKWAPTVPQKFSQLVLRMGDPDFRNGLWTILGTIFGSLFFAWIMSFVLKRYIPRPPLERPKILKRIWLGLIGTIIGLIPYLVLIVIVVLMFDLLEPIRSARNLIVLVMVVLFFYQLVYKILNSLLAPESPSLRILPFREQDVNYAWIWSIRFLKYTAFYNLITGAMLNLYVDHEAYAMIRGLLLLVFPLLLTVVVLQMRREIRMRLARSKPEAEQNEPVGKSGASPGSKVDEAADPLKITVESKESPEHDSRETSPQVRPKWPLWESLQKRPAVTKVIQSILWFWWIPTLAYVWALFVFMMGNFASGFDFLHTATWGTLAVALGMALTMAANNYGFKQLMVINDKIKKKFPGLEDMTNRYLRFVHLVTQGIIVVCGFLIMFEVWRIPVAQWLTSPLGLSIVTKMLVLAITLGLVILTVEVSRFITSQLLLEKTDRVLSQKRKTFIPLLNSLIISVACFIGVVVFLGQAGISVGPLLAGAGIIGVGLSFGSQSLVKDLINGLFILFQDMISVGDWAQLGNKSGLVEAISLRAVRLRDVSGNVHIIPNGSIDSVTNMTKGFSRQVLDIGVAYREDVDQVMDVLKRIGEEMRKDPLFGPDIIEPLEVLGLNEFGDSAVIIRARVTTKPMKQWAVGREFNRRIKKVFDELGIEIPFPHQTIYMGEPKTGPAPPLYIRTDSGSGRQESGE